MPWLESLFQVLLSKVGLYYMASVPPDPTLLLHPLSILVPLTCKRDYCRSIGRRASGRKQLELAVPRQGTKADNNCELTEREGQRRWLQRKQRTLSLFLA